MDYGFIERWVGVGFGGGLLSGAVSDGSMTMGQELWFPGDRVTPFEENILNVVLDGEAASALVVVPFNIDAGVVIACPILVDFIVFDEDDTKVVGVAFVDVFEAKIIHYKEE